MHSCRSDRQNHGVALRFEATARITTTEHPMNCVILSTPIVNHLGFRPDDPLKQALLPVTKSDVGFLGGFQVPVVCISEFIKHPLNTPGHLAAIHWCDGAVEDTPLGRYAVLDFSKLTARGGYQIQYGPLRSAPFLIYRDVWKRCCQLLLEWYRIAACGETVPGYHEACHLEDCRLPDGQPVDLVGGWHDAGDLRKWTSTMARLTGYLAELAREHAGRLDALGLDPALVDHQLRRGLTFLLKTIDPQTRRPRHSIAAAGDNSDNIWDGSRRVLPDTPPLTAHVVIEALCALARVLPESQPARAAAVGIAEALGDELEWPVTLALWRVTGEAAFQQRYVAGLRALRERQVTEPRFDQDLLRGYFLEEGRIAGNDGFGFRGGRNVFTHVKYAAWFAEALLEWPKHPDAPAWREAAQLILEGCIEPLLRRTPYRVLPTCFFAENETTLVGRPLAGRLRYRLFPHQHEGHNPWLANAAARLARCARALGQPKWAAYGQKQLEWICGFNPFDECMMTGLGYSRGAVFSPYVGQIPGGVINGFTGTADDEPQLCLNRELAPMNMEYWSMATATMLRALGYLEDERLS